MTERWRCAHGLTLSEQCEACDKELALETVRRHGQMVDEARRVIAEAERPEEQEVRG
jgi:hypothetical protein